MTLTPLALGTLALALVGLPPVSAQPPDDAPANLLDAAAPDDAGVAKPLPGLARDAGSVKLTPPGIIPPAHGRGTTPGEAPSVSTRLSLTRLPLSKLAPDLCLVRYRVSTTSPECQAFFDQGLGYFYSYVWMEAARSFETALYHDPDCAMAAWGLFRAMERWGRQDGATRALLRADELKGRASPREQMLILASMQEKGQAPGVGDAEGRKKAATATIDNLLAQYDDDEEGWYFRAQLAGGAGGFGGVVSAVPFYKALLRVNPLHPGANHELLHFYETYRRPALGWEYAENYIKSSPGIPHAFHMQAHLATRLGRWNKTSDRSGRAIELERAYHKEMDVRPQDDQQYSHHLETLLTSLTHDGRFAEGRAIKAEMDGCGYKTWLPWFRLHLAERDYDEALKIAEHFRKSDKVTASYLAALVYLKQGSPARALPEVEVLQHAFRDRKNDKQLELRLWETQGMLMCQSGDPDVGLKLIEKAVNRLKDDYSHHSWGNGAYYMEAWGIAALKANREAVAEEAFLEALAHDPGSVRAALGLQVLCEHQGRTDEAQRYAELAHRCWNRAEPLSLQTELADLRGQRFSARPEGQRRMEPAEPE
jgi:tetratricopeptide (TPR) repeat protein